ncbi:MAG: 3'-5' exonuclease [Chloroflexota bacterium]|nr:3'-5' exonuclease [Dehalococcoidia bacterium]MDW8253101.1 3'-5' exonuclease [Chloroflexota bacterium]
MLTDTLPLHRPIAFLDLETTGISTAHSRIVEIALFLVHPDGREEQNVFRVNPGIPIPADAVRVHGISDRDVIGHPQFSALAPTVEALLRGCDLAGFNIIRYDLPILTKEFQRSGRTFPLAGRALIDVMTLFHQRDGAQLQKRNLAAAVRHYCGREHVGAHSALADARATAEVLRRMLQRHRDLPRDVGLLHAYCRAARG